MDRAHGLLPETQLTSLARELDNLDPGVVQLVATHGDYQPRNWLQDNGQVKVIDFGRAERGAVRPLKVGVTSVPGALPC